MRARVVDHPPADPTASLPLVLRWYGPQGVATVTVTAEGVGVRGEMMPNGRLTHHLWDCLVDLLALDRVVTLDQACGRVGAERRRAEARAALQIRLGGKHLKLSGRSHL